MRVRQPPRVKHRNRVISLTAGLSGNLHDEEGRYFREREREREREVEHGKQMIFNEWQLVKLLSFFNNLRRKNFFFLKLRFVKICWLIIFARLIKLLENERNIGQVFSRILNSWKKLVFASRFRNTLLKDERNINDSKVFKQFFFILKFNKQLCINYYVYSHSMFFISF